MPSSGRRAPPGAAPAAGGGAFFFREGEYWTIGYEGTVSRLRDVRGLRYLAHLLERPGREVHAPDLVAAVAGGDRDAGGRWREALPRGDAGEALDATARAAYRRRLEELGEELEEAEAFNDLGRTARARAEMDALAQELVRGMGVSGRARRAGSGTERARLSVTKALKAAIEKVAEADPALGEHLRATVRTGTFCSYTPDPRSGLSWGRRALPTAPPAEVDPQAPAAWRRTRWVGREAEQAEIDRLLAAAAGGRGGLVMVIGEPGAGKSRFTEEVVAAARAGGVRVLTGRCYEMEGSPPYVPFVEVFEALSATLPPDEVREVLGHEAAEVAKLVPGLRLAFPDIPAPLEPPPDQERRYVLNSLREVLLRAAAGPSLLVLEDLHWADDASLRLLEHVALQLPRLPFLVVATSRPEGLDVAHPLAATVEALLRQGVVHRLDLGPLAEADVASLLEDLAGSPPPAAVGTAVHRHTEGNPFFVEEVFRHLAEEGALLDAEGRFRPDLVIDELEVPENVRLVLGRRLARLSRSAQDVLTAAAVVGRTFSYELLEAVGTLPPEALLDALEEAERARLIVAVAGDGEARFAFAHDLVRHTLVAGLATLRRRRLHAAVAEAMELAPGRGPHEQAAQLAHHLWEAGTVAESEKVLRYLTLAADEALAAAAFEDARRDLDRALSRVPPGDLRRRADLLVKAGVARRSLGLSEAALAAWYEALALYEELSAAEEAARLCWEIGWQLSMTVRLREAADVAQRGLAALGGRTTAERARLLASAVGSVSLLGDHEAATEMLAEARDVAFALGDDRLLADVLVAEALHHFTCMRFADTAAAASRAGELLAGAGAPWEVCQALTMVQHGLLHCGRLEELASTFEQLEPLASRLRHVPAILWGGRHRAVVELLATADLARFEAFAVRDLELCVSNALRWVSDSHTYLGLLGFWRGRWEDRRHLEEAAALEVPGAYTGRNVAYLFLQLAYAGDREGARAVLGPRRSALPRAGRKNGLGAWVLALAAVEGLAVMGDREEAAALYPLVVEAMATETLLRFLDVRLIETVAGIAASAGGRWEEAEGHFGRAARLAEELPNRIEQSDVRRFHAAMLVERDRPGDRGRAAALLARAVEGYRAIGMRGHERLAEEMLAST